MKPQASRALPCGCVQALPSGIMKQICQEHTKRLRQKPQPVAPTPGGKITYDPEKLEERKRAALEMGDGLIARGLGHIPALKAGRKAIEAGKTEARKLGLRIKP